MREQKKGIEKWMRGEVIIRHRLVTNFENFQTKLVFKVSKVYFDEPNYIEPIANQLLTSTSSKKILLKKNIEMVPFTGPH